MKQPRFTAAQGLQLFFVRKLLADRHTYGSLVGRRLGDQFFGQWSKIVREHESEPNFPRTIRVPEGFGKQVQETTGRHAPQKGDDEQTLIVEYPEPDLSFAPQDYHNLLRTAAFAPLLHLLNDDELAELMRIEYPADTSAIGVVTGTTVPEDLIREAIARELGKKPGDLTDADLTKIRALDLTGQEVTDLTPLADLAKLEHLWLGETQVSDLAPLANLTNLQELTLRRTQVSDLTPLAKLAKLEALWLKDTQVSDLTPLASLPDLRVLDARRTQVSDLAPLASLARLQTLSLEGTQVSDLAPLAKLAKLDGLWLSGTQVTDEQVAELQKALPKLTFRW